ncbi:hypothetical protein V2E38_11055 [Bifidobacterium longum subsp. infantis]|uniref:hypothetical protein n=1 Tax=Bifidobacterium longum TaxID=216816 RepID=UPI002EA9988E|nr:hypothetical protein [Bifidobacterium longum subsp. infantis]
MITVSFDDMTAGPDDLPLLRIADAANRIHGMDARLLPGLLESSWLDWAPPSSRLPDVGMPSRPVGMIGCGRAGMRDCWGSTCPPTGRA